jgi:hypothetical protein
MVILRAGLAPICCLIRKYVPVFFMGDLEIYNNLAVYDIRYTSSHKLKHIKGKEQG